MSVDKWDQRQLCSDGSCVGVIGPSGTCKVCGRAAPNWGDERKRGLVDRPEPGDAADEADDDADADAADAADVPEAITPSAPATIGEPAGWHERQVCSDGACIGLIGADGKCKVCGRPAGMAGGARSEPDHDLETADHRNHDDDEDDDPGDEEDRDEVADDEDDASEDEEDYDEEDEGEDDDDDNDDVEPDEERQLEAAASALAPVAIAEALGDNRKLCPDGACVGVIAPDGRCKLCGKNAA